MFLIFVGLLGAVVYWFRYPGLPQHTFGSAFRQDRAELKSRYGRRRAARSRVGAVQAQRSKRVVQGQEEHEAAVRRREDHQDPKEEGEGNPLGPMRLHQHSVHVPGRVEMDEQGDVSWARVDLADLEVEPSSVEGNWVLNLKQPSGIQVLVVLPHNRYQRIEAEDIRVKLENAIVTENAYRAGRWKTEDAQLSEAVDNAAAELESARAAEVLGSPDDEAAAKAAEADLDECRDRWKAMTGIRPVHLF